MQQSVWKVSEIVLGEDDRKMTHKPTSSWGWTGLIPAPFTQSPVWTCPLTYWHGVSESDSPQCSAAGSWRRWGRKTQTGVEGCGWSWRLLQLSPAGRPGPRCRIQGRLLLPLGKHTQAGASPRPTPTDGSSSLRRGTPPRNPTGTPHSSPGNTEALAGRRTRAVMFP